MKKWIFGIVLVVIGVVALLIKVYLTALEPVNIAEQKATALAKKKTDLSEVIDFHVYHGQETVDVIEGKDHNGEEIIIFIPEKNNKIYVQKAKNGLTKKEAVQKLYEETNPQKIISVRLGMEKNIPLWEIYYRSNNNLINYYYVDFKTGEWLKKIENL